MCTLQTYGITAIIGTPLLAVNHWQAVLIGFVLSVKMGLDMLDPAGGGKKPTFVITEEDVLVRFFVGRDPAGAVFACKLGVEAIG